MEIKEKVRNQSIKTKRKPVIRQKAKYTYKTLNKSAKSIERKVLGTSSTIQKAKQASKNIDTTEEQHTDTGTTSNDFAVEKINHAKNEVTAKGKTAAISMTKWSAKTVKKETTKSIKHIKSNTASRTVRTGTRPVKTAQNSAKTFRRGKSALKKGRYPIHRYRRTVHTSKKAVASTKAAMQSLAAVLKTIAIALKSLITFLIAGGWLVLIIILFAGLIAALLASVFSIFFGNGYDDPKQNLTYGINEINTEFYENIKQLANGESYDQTVITINGSVSTDINTVWKQVLTVYAVRMTTGDNADTAIDFSDQKRRDMLRTIFFDMVAMTGNISTITEEIPDGEDGTTNIERKVLNVSVTTKSAEHMKIVYSMDTSQCALIDELLAPSMDNAWRELLYGSSISDNIGNGNIVETALSQLGNIGGQPYWSWYGFNSRVEWCACFVSWCAEQNGFISAGIIPKFANCDMGIKWFKDRDQWKGRGYSPQPGDIIFFDWNYDGISDHVGIVEYTRNGVVYTIEGNSGDTCARMSYAINSNVIQGYGTPNYILEE